MEVSAYASVNRLIGCLSITTSLFCGELSSRCQKKKPKVQVKHGSAQASSLRNIKQLGTLSMSKRPSTSEGTVSVVVSTDAVRPSDHGQLAYLASSIIGGLCKDAVVHPISWTSHKS